MSVEIMSEVWGLDLPGGLKLTLLAYADHADDDGLCWPGNQRVARKTGSSVRTIQRHKTELEDRGVLEVVENPKGGRGKVTQYRVRPEKGDSLTPLNPEKGDTDDAKGDSSDGERVTPVSPKPSKNRQEPPEEPPPYSEESLRDEYGDHAVEFTRRFIERQEEINPRRNPPDPGTELYRDWVLAFDRLNRIGPQGGTEGETGYSWDELAEILQWIFEDDFWRNQVRSPIRLRDEKIVTVEDQMNGDSRNESSDFADQWEDAV